tara:strand:+ start:851 stop:1030 length:180 start_codon:yes stop_codon:yes gene_type:complete
MKVEIGDIVRHGDGDIGVVLDKMERYKEQHEDDKLYAIHWMRDGFLEMSRYERLEVLNG